jgi:hypothetical protein
VAGPAARVKRAIAFGVDSVIASPKGEAIQNGRSGGCSALDCFIGFASSQ